MKCFFSNRILFSAPLAVFCYMMIWYVPDISRELKTFWYLGFYCLFQTFLSVKFIIKSMFKINNQIKFKCLHVPYTSLTMYLTPSQSERDSATGYSNIMFLKIFHKLIFN